MFEEEIVKKDNADKILHGSKTKLNTVSSDERNQFNFNEVDVSNAKKKRKGTIHGEVKNTKFEEQTGGENKYITKVQNDGSNKVNKKEKKRKFDTVEDDASKFKSTKKNKSREVAKEQTHENEGEENLDLNLENSTANAEIKTTESKRAMKRKKHEKLTEEKKLQTELKLQQNALNYLSKWKHSRADWKFEKLKQIWLQQNLYDSSKIPEEFWETTVAYFSGSKGFIRNKVLKEALKTIEDNETQEEKPSDEDNQIKVQRARDVIQNLQE